jgi:hypothetical protein
VDVVVHLVQRVRVRRQPHVRLSASPRPA